MNKKDIIKETPGQLVIDEERQKEYWELHLGWKIAFSQMSLN